MKKIGIITSGGDGGGLNAVIKGVAREAANHGVETVVIPNGYAGLYNLVDLPELAVLDGKRLLRIDAAQAGSEAGHSRVKISKIADPAKYDRIKEGLKKFGVDALVISGGDDTGSVAVDLSSRGIPCVHVPKTMDLDLQTYSVGGDSAVTRIAQFCNDLKTTGLSHNRILVVEVFGRYVGHTAFRGGTGAEADCILIPEIPVDFDIVYDHLKATYCARVEKSDVKAGTYLIVVAEGLRKTDGENLYDETAGVDAFGHKRLAGAGRYVRQELERRLEGDADIAGFMKRTGQYVLDVYTAPEVREIAPGHLVRSGPSSAFDVNFGTMAGAAAVVLLLKGFAGNTVVSVVGDRLSYMPTAQAILRREVDVAELALFESLGVCFGRKPVVWAPEIALAAPVVPRHL